MGVQREPGQKGVNWSNIAVGASSSFVMTQTLGWSNAGRSIHPGGIMNMVFLPRFNASRRVADRVDVVPVVS